MSDIILGLDDFGLYNLWLWTLALNFASSLLLVDSYIKSKGTPIGKSAFYFFLGSLLWGITTMAITIPILQASETFGDWFYLSFTFLASIASSLGTYERTRIQILLTPGTKEQVRDNRLWFIVSFCIFAVASVGVIVTMMNSSILVGIGGLTGLGFILIAGLCIALTQTKLTRKLVYVGSTILLIIGVTVISGWLLGIPILYSQLPGGPMKIPTAVFFIIAGLWIANAKLSGLKWWIAKITMALAILFTVVLQFVTYLFRHSLALSSPTLFLIVLVGGAFLWRTWKTPNR